MFRKSSLITKQTKISVHLNLKHKLDITFVASEAKQLKPTREKNTYLKQRFDIDKSIIRHYILPP